MDDSEKIIYDPLTADIGSYTQLLGYYDVSPWNGVASIDVENNLYYFDGIFYSYLELMNYFRNEGIIQVPYGYSLEDNND